MDFTVDLNYLTREQAVQLVGELLVQKVDSLEADYNSSFQQEQQGIIKYESTLKIRLSDAQCEELELYEDAYLKAIYIFQEEDMTRLSEDNPDMTWDEKLEWLGWEIDHYVIGD